MWYLVYFLHRYLDFRLQELESLLQLALIDHPQDFETASVEINAQPLQLHTNAGQETMQRVSDSFPSRGDFAGDSLPSPSHDPSRALVAPRDSELANEAASQCTDISPVNDTLSPLSAVENGSKADAAKPGQPLPHNDGVSNVVSHPQPLVSASRGANGAASGSTGGMAGDGGGPATLRWRKPEGDHVDSPFFYVDLPSDDVARAIASRSVLIKGIFDVWGEAPSYDALSDVITAVGPDVRDLKITPFIGPNTSFKLVVDGFGKIFNFEEQLARIERITFVPFQGPVNLTNPDVKFWVIECAPDCTNNGLPPGLPPRIFLGRQVAVSDRSVVTRYELKGRKYLGPTAMDAEVAFLMANQALAKRGSLVYDPFVGTGSILVAAAHRGAMTLGADIDIRVVRDGRGPDSNVWSNFSQYGLPAPLGLVRGDNNSPPWRTGLTEIFDAIICDPPYGVRAGGRKSGGRKLLNGVVEPYVIPDELKPDHIPSTAPYTLAECLHDLLDMSARMLAMGGRLVYFYPAARGEGILEDMPSHPCFRLVANSEQILTRRWSRRLLTMEKVTKYTEEVEKEHLRVHEEFRDNHKEMLEESRRKGDMHDLVFAPADQVATLHHAGSRKEKKAKRPQYRAKCV